MRTVKLIFNFLIILFLNSCEENSCTFELDPVTHDTINLTNERGRQGRWVINTDCVRDLPRLPKDSISKQDTIDISKNQGLVFVFNPSLLEIGNYVDNKRQGPWTYYSKDGTINKTVEFKDDLPMIN